MAKLIGTIYASSLFEVAKELDEIESVFEELSFITDRFFEDKKFYHFFTSTTVGKEERKEVIDNIYGQKINNALLNFLKILIDKNRASSIFDIKNVYASLLDQQRNVKRVTIESVVELTDAHKTKLIHKLSDLTGSEIVLKNVITPEILGGVIMRIDNEIVDASVLSKLNNIQNSVSKIII
jgi:F-type H+-transporting ATPase subunit delta